MKSKPRKLASYGHILTTVYHSSRLPRKISNFSAFLISKRFSPALHIFIRCVMKGKFRPFEVAILQPLHRCMKTCANCDSWRLTVSTPGRLINRIKLVSESKTSKFPPFGRFVSFCTRNPVYQRY